MDFATMVERAFDVATIIGIMGLTQVVKNMAWVKPHHIPWIPAILGVIAGPVHLLSSGECGPSLLQCIMSVAKYGLGYGGASALTFQLVLEPLLKSRQAKKEVGGE